MRHSIRRAMATAGLVLMSAGCAANHQDSLGSPSSPGATSTRTQRPTVSTTSAPPTKSTAASPSSSAAVATSSQAPLRRLDLTPTRVGPVALPSNLGFVERELTPLLGRPQRGTYADCPAPGGKLFGGTTLTWGGLTLQTVPSGKVAHWVLWQPAGTRLRVHLPYGVELGQAWSVAKSGIRGQVTAAGGKQTVEFYTGGSMTWFVDSMSQTVVGAMSWVGGDEVPLGGCSS